MNNNMINMEIINEIVMVNPFKILLSYLLFKITVIKMKGLSCEKVCTIEIHGGYEPRQLLYIVPWLAHITSSSFFLLLFSVPIAPWMWFHCYHIVSQKIIFSSDFLSRL